MAAASPIGQYQSGKIDESQGAETVPWYPFDAQGDNFGIYDSKALRT